MDRLSSLPDRQKICGQQFQRLITLAANGHTESLHHPLLKDRTFQLFSASVNNAQSLQCKKIRAIHKAIYLTFGTSHPYFSYKILEKKYWQEALLPHHPSGAEIHDTFKNWEKSDFPCSFEAFLFKKNCDVGIPSVIYLNPQERKDFAVEFTHGRIYKNGNPFSTLSVNSQKSNHSAIYAILPDEKMYIGPYILGKFHHSSFSAGQPVLGAGEIITNAEGEIKSISSKSGHFKPCAKQLLETLQYLEEQQVNLTDITLIENSIDSLSRHPSAEAFLVNQCEKIESPRGRQSPKGWKDESPYLSRRIPSPAFARSNSHVGWDLSGRETPSPSMNMFFSATLNPMTSNSADEENK